MKGLESLLLFVSPVSGFTLSICSGDPLSWGLQVRENKAFKVVKGTRTDGDSSNGDSCSLLSTKCKHRC